MNQSHAPVSERVRTHYETYPYPEYPLLAAVRRCDTYALNLKALWGRFNGQLLPEAAARILIAGCGSFSPYPFSIANPDCTITALDLSARSLRRAKLHCSLHLRGNVTFRTGDILDDAPAEPAFGFIDAFGVLHHLDDPLSGLKALERKLAIGGIMRIMIYSRYARREEESVRRAFRLLGVKTAGDARRIISRVRPGSRLDMFVKSSFEVGFEAGIADALLHPKVRTFRIDELMELIDRTELEPLLFAHSGALENVREEVERIRDMERNKETPGNFILYLGRSLLGKAASGEASSRFILNPCLENVTRPFFLGSRLIQPRLGVENPPLDAVTRRMLWICHKPAALSEIKWAGGELIAHSLRSLFLICIRSNEV